MLSNIKRFAIRPSPFSVKLHSTLCLSRSRSFHPLQPPLLPLLRMYMHLNIHSGLPILLDGTFIQPITHCRRSRSISTTQSGKLLLFLVVSAKSGPAEHGGLLVFLRQHPYREIPVAGQSVGEEGLKAFEQISCTGIAAFILLILFGLICLIASMTDLFVISGVMSFSPCSVPPLFSRSPMSP